MGYYLFDLKPQEDLSARNYAKKFADYLAKHDFELRTVEGSKVFKSNLGAGDFITICLHADGKGYVEVDCAGVGHEKHDIIFSTMVDLMVQVDDFFGTVLSKEMYAEWRVIQVVPIYGEADYERIKQCME